MLQNVSSRVGAGLHAAALARRAADAAKNHVGRRRHLTLEQTLARSEEFAESFNCILATSLSAAAPRRESARPVAPLGRSDDGTLSSESPLIAVVDDHEMVRTSMRVLLESLGYRAAMFADAMEYLRSDLLNDFACLITDLQMPGMSGFELQAKLIADGSTTPVIFLTALAADSGVRARALQSGAFGFLSKPCDADDLIAALDRALAAGRVA